jgi:hypothetical protein
VGPSGLTARRRPRVVIVVVAGIAAAVTALSIAFLVVGRQADEVPVAPSNWGGSMRAA